MEHLNIPIIAIMKRLELIALMISWKNIKIISILMELH